MGLQEGICCDTSAQYQPQRVQVLCPLSVVTGRSGRRRGERRDEGGILAPVLNNSGKGAVVSVRKCECVLDYRIPG